MKISITELLIFNNSYQEIVIKINAQTHVSETIADVLTNKRKRIEKV